MSDENRKNADALVADLKRRANPANVAGMARFGINPKNTLGVSVADLRRLAKPYRRQHGVARLLWATGIHEARVLATIIADPARTTATELDRWALDLDSWDTCDQFCMNLVGRTPHAWAKVAKWSRDRREFVRRAGFSLIAVLATHDKTAPDENFIALLPLIRADATDERNFVKKAVNWALRGIGKRNPRLRRAALAEAKRLAESDSPAARWIGKDAVRELENYRNK
jgi:3-methyladenine DNA glycosylase AlkD